MMPCKIFSAKTLHYSGMTYLLNVDPCIPFPQGMLISQLSDYGNRMQTGVLGESGRDDLKSFGIRLEAVGLFAFQSLRVLCE